MGSLFGELFGAPAEAGGLFSASSLFRRNTDEPAKTSAPDKYNKVGDGQGANDVGYMEGEQKHKRRKTEAKEKETEGAVKGRNQNEVAKDSDVLQLIEHAGENGRKTRKALRSEPRNWSTPNKGRLEESNAADDMPKKAFSHGPASVALTADSPLEEPAAKQSQKKAGKRSQKPQPQERHIRLDTEFRVEGPTTTNTPSAGRLAQPKRSRGEDHGEHIRHVVELQDELDLKPKKKKAKVQDDSDDDNAGKVAIEKRQTAKKRKRSEKDKLPRTIFVGNLPPAVKRKELRKEFSKYGPIESVRLRSLALEESKMPRKAAILTGKTSDLKDSVNAYVVFEEADSAKKALAHNMQEFSGHHVRVDLAVPARSVGAGAPVEYDRLLSVFVGNLPYDVKDEEVICAFSAPSAPAELEGALEAVRVVRDKATGLGKGIAYVMFKTKAASKIALATTITVRDRQLRLTRPGAKLKPRTKATTSSGKARGAPRPAVPLQRAGASQGTEGHKGRASWEGSYAKKADGKPGKGGGRIIQERSRERAAGKKGQPGGTDQRDNRKRAGKRPAVAARKAKAGKPTTEGATPVVGAAFKGGRKPTGQPKPIGARKADKKKASKGTASFQVKGRKQ